jgi:4-hydroxybenzoate polyprenyltransferase
MMKDVLREIRFHQWAKNVLVFLPLITAHRVFEDGALMISVRAFLAFCLCASAGYVLNDIVDLAADRAHPMKKNRPLASGSISPVQAWILASVLLTAGLAIGAFLPGLFLLVLVGYFGTSLLYSLYFKKIALLDVLILAGLYTVRIFAGSAATGIPISEWLLAFSMFFFLSLALAKRFSELRLLAGEPSPAVVSARGYSSLDLDYIPIMGICSGFLTSLVMALYVSGDHVRSLYRQPEYLWLICPLILYWISRVWLFCHRGQMNHDPVVFALTDRVSFIVLLLSLGVMAFAS